MTAIFDPVLWGASFILAAGSGQNLCAMDKPARIHVKPTSARLRIDTSKSLKDLQTLEVDTFNPHAFHGVSVTKGVMQGRIRIEPEVKLTTVSYDRQGIGCVWYDSINVELDIDPVILIPREVRRDRCMYRAVLDHEKKHVRVDREIVNKYAKIMGRELRNALDDRGYAVGPIPLDQIDSIAARMQNTVFQVIDLQSQKMKIERTEKQQAIDTKEEYERVAAQCPEFREKNRDLMIEAGKSAAPLRR